MVNKNNFVLDVLIISFIVFISIITLSLFANIFWIGVAFLFIMGIEIIDQKKKHKQKISNMSQEFKSPMKLYEQKLSEEGNKPISPPSNDKLVSETTAEDALGFINNFVFIASSIAAIVLLSKNILGIAVIIGAWLSEVIFWLGIKVFIKISRNIEEIKKNKP